jgi:hypothetical protein
MHVLKELIPLLAGKISLSNMRALVEEYTVLRQNKQLCPFLCRAAVALEFYAAGFPRPRGQRLAVALHHLIRAWPLPISANSLAKVWGSRWPGEALDFLHRLENLGYLTALRQSGRLSFHLQEGRFIPRQMQDLASYQSRLEARDRNN